MNKSIKSITKKIKTISKGGLKNIQAIKEGVDNFNNPKLCVEHLANERIKTCVDCPFYTHEPNVALRIDDNRIIDADEMMCDDCGCALPYKIRQSKIKCNKWEK